MNTWDKLTEAAAEGVEIMGISSRVALPTRLKAQAIVRWLT
ncbi:MAG: hypothetical protein QXK88_04825 [Desulfurococcaceae archaeon]